MRRRHFVYGDECDPVELQERDALIEKVHLGIWDAFLELSRSRNLGAMSIGYIPHSEFESFCRIHELKNQSIRRDWWVLIRILDDEYVRSMNAPKAD